MSDVFEHISFQELPCCPLSYLVGVCSNLWGWVFFFFESSYYWIENVFTYIEYRSFIKYMSSILSFHFSSPMYHFLFYDLYYYVPFKKSLSNPTSQRFSPKGFRLLGSTFSFVMQFESFSETCKVKVEILFSPCKCSFVLAWFMEKLFFIHWITWAHALKTIDHIYLWVCFWSISIFLPIPQSLNVA